jgi:hypothetical protein
MRRVLGSFAACGVIVACSSSDPPATTCNDTPLPTPGKDCAVAGLYSVREEPRCPDNCNSGSRTMNPVNINLNIAEVTFTFDSQDNRAEHVKMDAKCTLKGCDCTGDNGLHVVFQQTEWFSENLTETVTGLTCISRAYHHGTRNN